MHARTPQLVVIAALAVVDFVLPLEEIVPVIVRLPAISSASSGFRLV